MRAVQFAETGGPEVLRLRDIPEPTPGPGEVSIDVHYAGVNFVEVMARRGGYAKRDLPLVPGFEVSGRVRALGPGVTGLRVGERVAAMTVVGGYAEVAIARMPLIYSLGDSISFEQGAAFPAIVPTAYALLSEVARLREGETVLAHAAAGGVGAIVGQMAKRLGAGKVLGTVGSPEKIDYARRFGYDQVFPREGFVEAIRRAMDGAGVDIVLESVGGSAFTESMELLAPLGRLVVFGNASNSPFPPVAPQDLWYSNRSVMGFSIGHLGATAPDRLAEIAGRALKMVAEGSVTVDITEIFPLEQAAEAHRRLENRATVGKMLLRVREE